MTADNRSTPIHLAPSTLVGAFLLAVALGLPGCGWLEGVFGGGWGAPVEEGPTPAARPEPETAPVAGAPLIRVGLAHKVEEAEVSCGGGLAVTVFADSVSTYRSPEGGRWRFRAADGGVEARGPGGALPRVAGTVRVAPEGAAPVSFDGTSYRGEIEVFAAAPGSLSVGNILSVESYLLGVVPLEIGRRAPEEIEAVKAQAVAARTYAVAASGSRASGSFDVFPTVEDQVYGGIDAEEPVSRRAIIETAGIIAEHDGGPITAYFHSSCGGRTEAREEIWELPGLPYLRSILDVPGGSRDLGVSYCRDAADFTWTETWTGPEIAELIERHLPAVASTPVREPIGRVHDLRVTARTPSGRSRWLTVETDGGTYRVFGDRVRWRLRRPDTARILRSSWFELDVERRGGRVVRVVARGRGNGHGVGMCQHGALGMARRGYTYDEILEHYYRGIELVRAYSAGAQEPPGETYESGVRTDPAP
jgi:stage II sporulation protein D